jgi:hypothetical protein
MSNPVLLYAYKCTGQNKVLLVREMKVSGGREIQLHTPANFCLYKNTGTHGKGDRVNPSANFDVLNSVSSIQNISE